MKRLVLAALAVALATSCSFVTETGSWTTRGALEGLVPMQSVALGLKDGRALYIGGVVIPPKGPPRPLTTVRIYDPTRNEWPAAADLPTPLATPSVTLLADGRVLVTGGRGVGNQPSAKAFLYDPASDSWAAAGTMTEARTGQVAVQMTNGEVLVTGGQGAEPLLSELFDPTGETWSRAANLAHPSFGAVATPLRTGEVLVMGGFSGQAASAGGGFVDPNTGQQAPNRGADLYDPVNDTWSTLPGPGFPVVSPLIATMGDGRLFVLSAPSFGPRSGGSGIPAIFDPHKRSWIPAAYLPSSTSSGSAGAIAISALADGRVAVLELGIGTAEVLVYVPSGNYWGFGPKVQVGQIEVRPLRLTDGRLLLATGSISYDHTSTIDIYDASLPLGANGGPLDSSRLSWILTGLVAVGLIVLVTQFLVARRPPNALPSVTASTPGRVP